MSTNDSEECVVTVPFRDVQAVPAHECTGRSTMLIREHLTRHLKVDAENVRLDTQINEDTWVYGWQSPPSKSRVRVARFDEDGESVVETELAE